MAETDKNGKPTAVKTNATKKPAGTAAKKPAANGGAAKKPAGTAAKKPAASGSAAKKPANGSAAKKPASATATKKPASEKKQPVVKIVTRQETAEKETEAQETSVTQAEATAAAAQQDTAVNQTAEQESAASDTAAQETSAQEAAAEQTENTAQETAAQEAAAEAGAAQETAASEDAAAAQSRTTAAAEQIEIAVTQDNAAGAASENSAAQGEDGEGQYLLRVRNLKKYFPIKKDFFGRPKAMLRAVDDVSFDLKRGKTLGIVGESGCGKTTMGRTILKLHEPTGGKIIFNGIDIAPLKPSKLRPMRTKMQIIFQDPYSSLPPRMPVGGIIGEAVKYHKIVPADKLHAYVLDIMDKCGLRDYYYERYPHEFSGGQRQRICIARALAVNPELIVCDEPVSALDVSIQAQIINLLKDLQKSLGLTYLFISHDLSVVKHISDEVGVMYLGSMVEFGSNESIFKNPMHPYTNALFSAVPVPDPNVKMNRIILKGDIPSPANPPSGCKFHTRCPRCMDICSQTAPVYREYEKGHFVACHLYPQE